VDGKEGGLMVKLIAAIVLALGACQGCTPVPPVAPTPDASDASTLGEAAPTPSAALVDPICVSACAALVAAGCGQQSTCASTLTDVEGFNPPHAHLRIDPSVNGPANWVTCTTFLAVKSPAQAQAHGWSCAP
jgi:hypothetical protein